MEMYTPWFTKAYQNFINAFFFLGIVFLSACVGGKKFESLQKEHDGLVKKNKILEVKLDSVVDITRKQRREINTLTEALAQEKAKYTAYNNQVKENAITKKPIQGPALSKEDEYNQKANFVLNFGKFIFWPRDYIVEKDFTIGVYGKSAITDKLIEVTNGKTINGKKISIQVLEVGKPIQNVHIVFFPEASNAQIPALVAKIKSLPILVITENLENTNKNYMLNFLDTDEKVKFSLNRQNANAAGLNVNLDLMKLSF